MQVIELLKLRILHLAIMLDENLEFGQRNIITSWDSKIGLYVNKHKAPLYVNKYTDFQVTADA